MLKTLSLVSVVVFYCFGIYFYCKGFLLTRQAVLLKSSCEDVQYPRDSAQGCWTPPSFKKAVFIVIDALRFDFIQWKDVDPNEFHHNKLPVLREILDSKVENSALFRFVADPPTTTLQRLKGLTTGSLPTFIDAGSNFAGSEIEEDNIISQIRTNGRGNVSFLGDDTWISLFPGAFSRESAFPSFDVKDLHTVDNGILKNLNGELERDDWKLLIAHFLGVDHCGHRYGPYHPKMKEKLSQMNDMLRNVIQKIDEDTVLFVFGDHGMTGTGDHGGDSSDELNAGLFVYSSARKFNQTIDQRGREVHQIDLVPTISLLLDFPVPFSSLGAIIPELFPHATMKAVAEANAWQVIRYTENYKKYLTEHRVAQNLDVILRKFHDSNRNQMTAQDYLDVVEEIRQIFQESWARFHPEWMLIGVMTILENFLWSLLLLRDQLGGRRLLVKILGSFPLMTVAAFGEKESVPSFVGILVCLQVTWNLYGLANDLIIRRPLAIPGFGSFFPVLILLLSCAALFSNSFVVHEDLTIRFLISTLIVFYGIRGAAANCQISESKLKRKLGTNPGFVPISKNFISWKVVFAVIIALIAIRFGATVNRCREEQGPDCIPSSLSLPFASLPDDQTKSLRYLAAIVSLIICTLLFSRFLLYNGHSEGYTALTIITRIVTTVVPLLIGAFWTAQWLPEISLERYKALIQIGIPLTVYGISVLHALIHLYNPLLVFLMHTSDRKRPQARWPNGTIDRKAVYNYVNQNWQDYLRKDNDAQGKVYVFGMVSAYSGSLIAFLFPWTLVLILLLGDGISSSVSLLLIIGIILLELQGHNGRINLLPAWCLLAVNSFYAFGHHATFSSIPWEAAFVGIPGNFPYQIAPAALVLLNVNAGHILLGLSLPLTYIWGYYSGKLGPLKLGATEENSSELGLAGTGPQIAWRATLQYITLLALRLMGMTLCSVVHQRHLMLWKIFAPKFIFEGVSFIVSTVASLIGYFIFLRINSALTSML